MDDIILKYKFGDEVVIKDINTVGMVISVWIKKQDIQYEIRYYKGEGFYEKYFYEEELENNKDASAVKVGFKKP